MSEELRIVPRLTRTPSPTLRDMFAVLFRQKRLATISFFAILSAILLWGLLFPNYQSEMKILVRRSRTDPVITATPSQSQQFERDQITEEELNSEAELLRSQDILGQVVQDSGLSDDTWFSELRGDNSEKRIARAIRGSPNNWKWNRFAKRQSLRSATRRQIPRNQRGCCAA